LQHTDIGGLIAALGIVLALVVVALVLVARAIGSRNVLAIIIFIGLCGGGPIGILIGWFLWPSLWNEESYRRARSRCRRGRHARSTPRT
jgi:hypothetical protein